MRAFYRKRPLFKGNNTRAQKRTQCADIAEG